MPSLRSTAGLLFALCTLGACSDLKEDLGLGRSAPDEFAVVDRPPLSMPPDFGLRPPQPGAPRPQDVDMTQRANDVLFNSAKVADSSTPNAAPAPNASANVEPSSAEKALLEQTGADKAPDDIRETINRESSEKVGVSEHLVQDLLWWKKDEPPGTTVDAPVEAARIKEAKDKGEPLNQGATPVIEEQKSSWLGL